MKKLLFVFVALFFTASFSMAGSYTIDDASIDALIENAAPATDLEAITSFDQLKSMDELGVNGLDTEALIATVVCYFFGVLGAHRWYLGSDFGTYIVYFCTGGGFGCLVTIDFFILLINGLIKGEGVGAYENNDKLFMWK